MLIKMSNEVKIIDGILVFGKYRKKFPEGIFLSVPLHDWR